MVIQDAAVGSASTGGRLPFGPRRGVYVDAVALLACEGSPLDARAIAQFDAFDLAYRTVVAMMFNFVPMSGHPGGSISSGRIVSSLLFGAMDYDLHHPERRDADQIVFAAGHKALGLYTMWALRNEVARIAAPELLPRDDRRQLRLEDLLGFRRNPVQVTPLIERFGSKALDGHPTPATPFVRLATGASGVGLPAAIGLAWGAKDVYGADAPKVHVIEGEGGLTPGRVAEALAAAGTGSIGNVILHVDWNQASIDSNRVCRDGEQPGDYVQWTPAELAYLHDWNVIEVRDGFDWRQVAVAQRAALAMANGQPTVIVYRTVKGWQYGIEGRASHGAGHALCSDGFHAALEPLLPKATAGVPCCAPGTQRCGAGTDAAQVEQCFWDSLLLVRQSLEANPLVVAAMAQRLRDARERLERRARTPRDGAPHVDALYHLAMESAGAAPATLVPAPGTKTTLRDELGKVLHHYNRASGGAVVVAAADLLGSTSISKAADGFPAGFWNATSNPLSRQLSIGGICEDAMTAMLSGIAAYGAHVGAGSSYGAFLAPLGHIASRLHAIGNQARVSVEGGHYRPFFLVCAHAGLKTGEDGPTHADPQALQLLQDNFPPNTVITLTPWDPQEMWYVVSAALAARPAVIAPFVTRPPETVLDRAALGLPPASAAARGVYRLRAAKGRGIGTVVLHGSAVTYAFVEHVLPKLDAEKLDVHVYCVTSTELFDRLPEAERERTFPEAHQFEAMGITDFTLPTIARFVRSDYGRTHTLHPFRHGHFLGSGSGAMVLAEAGLDGASQLEALKAYVAGR